MSTLTLTPTTKGIQSSSTTSFAEMRAGHGLGVNTTKQTGQSQSGSSWIGNELFCDIDLSSLPSAATVSAAVLKPTGTATIGANATDLYNAYVYDFGTSVDTSDWRTTEPGGVGSAFAHITNPHVNGMPSEFTDGSTNTVLSVVLAAGTGHLRFVIAGQNQLQGSTGVGDQTLTFGGLQLQLTYSLPAPTVASVSPSDVLLAGGDITITGSNFQQPGAGTTTVTIGGNSATSVHVVSDTSITCTAPAHAAGRAAVTVTNSNGTSTAVVDLYYVSVQDNVVKLIKGGTLVGDNKADTATDWPLAETAVVYGGPTDMWGTTWTPTDVDGTTFGMVFSATLGALADADVYYAEATVYFTVPGSTDPASYLVTLQVAADGQTATPEIYKLPRSGFTVGQDNSIDRSQSDATFVTSRMFSPSRTISKTYRAFEVWVELSPETNTPGLQVWASVEDGDFFQLLDSGDGDAVTITTSGFHRLYFPTTTASVGRYVQFKYVIPALDTGQVPVAVAVRDVTCRMSLRPVRTEVNTVRIVLGGGEYGDNTSMRYTIEKQIALLEALIGPDVEPQSFRDPVTGETGYMDLVDMKRVDASDPQVTQRTELADVVVRRTFYAAN